MKHIGFFNDFLAQEVNLNQSRLDRLNDHVSSVTSFLSDDLDGFEKTEKQGSHGLRTIIKPVSGTDEYDADMLLYVAIDADKTPTDYINAVYDCFRSSSTYKDKVHRRTRCVTLNYADDFHLDVVPCIEESDGNAQDLQQQDRRVRTDRRNRLQGLVQRQKQNDGRASEAGNPSPEVSTGPQGELLSEVHTSDDSRGQHD